MKNVRGTPVTDERLTSSTVAEPEAGYPAWVSGTSYAIGAKVSRGRRRWESLVASNAGNDPLLTTGKWLDIGPTNRWAMFDLVIGTRTTASGPIEVVLAPGAIDTLVLLDLDAASVTVEMKVGSTVVYPAGTRSTNIGGAAIDNWFSYFLEPVGRRTTMIFDDLPVFANCSLKVTIAPPASGTAAVGTLVVGRMFEIGDTEEEPDIGVQDFSLFDEDERFGTLTVVERGYVGKASVSVLCDATRVDAIRDVMVAQRATASVWIIEDGSDALILFGFCRNWSLRPRSHSAIFTATLRGVI